MQDTKIKDNQKYRYFYLENTPESLTITKLPE